MPAVDATVEPARRPEPAETLAAAPEPEGERDLHVARQIVGGSGLLAGVALLGAGVAAIFGFGWAAVVAGVVLMALGLALAVG